MILEQTKQVN